MPLYDLTCPECALDSEHLMGMDDNSALMKCPHCGARMTRQEHKKYHGMRVQIQGDNVPRGCSYDYWDDGLDCHIKNRQHREDEMKRQGLEPYSPDPEMKAHRAEQRYIKKNSKPGDASAAKAVLAEKRAAQTKRREKAVSRVFDEAPLPVLPEL